MEHVEAVKIWWGKNDYITLYDKQSDVDDIMPLYESVLFDVNYEIKDGVLYIEGNERIFDFYFDRTYEKDWQHEPVESDIKKNIFGWKYLCGWVVTKEFKKVKHALSNFSLKY